MATQKEVLEIARREVTITNPQKVYFPGAGYTKLDLVRYYVAVAEGAVRGVAGRPMALKRYVDGIDEPVYSTNGLQVGSRKRYSDKLLALRAQSMMPDRYAARTVAQIEQNTTVQCRPSLGLDQLSPESRADLRKILERELGEPSADLPTMQLDH